ncbi:MAG TPA: hypothetical protein VMP68_32715 [Candidatus Eisenbacteria bacterium]|nr:hypothetical protein [Candidatus Eisenbacteria bacterium]
MSKWGTTVLQVLFLFSFVTALGSVARAQAHSNVTRGDESYELQGQTLPEDPTNTLAASAQDVGLSDVSISIPDTDESRMPHSGSGGFVQIKEGAPPEKNVKWRVANQESLLFTGIMHTFNVWTEAGTRDTLNGHWFQQYVQSVGELRGWSDGDLFMSPYVGHTIEGAVFGYILRQNDPKYRAVQWGDGREYFISVLRSLAYSAVWHTQWKIGPASEASIGNVMLHASPGFITLTDTPTLGTVAMIGEDAADRYVIMGLENRTSNPALIMLARSFLNPSRSFANVMAFRHPWHRETRMGIFGRNHEIRKEMIANYHETGEKAFEYERPVRTEKTPSLFPKEAAIELTAFPVFQSFLGGGTCIGGGGSGAGRINSNWQYVAELSGCLVMRMPASNQSGDSLFYGGGVRWAPRASHSISPYLQFMIGGNKVTHETDDIALREQLLAEWNDGNGTLPHYPKRSDWSVQVSKNAPAVKLAAGFDLVLTRPFAWRLLDVEYSHAWMGDVVNIHPQNAIRISTGAVLRIGTW